MKEITPRWRTCGRDGKGSVTYHRLSGTPEGRTGANVRFVCDLPVTQARTQPRLNLGLYRFLLFLRE
ncbi:hypothetical protein E2C01_065089 [Portunus trituberculatus]|uniref:Uncharacterized protein n=1 Tax=Portunus trituberculatus TaxID=210409 RepID=A0A5B7HM31_PORTR|nr:hypothetical protein [Portunus trituberculatus]